MNRVVEAALLDAEDLPGVWCCATPWIAEFKDHCPEAHAVYQTSRRLDARADGIGNSRGTAQLRLSTVVFPEGFGAASLVHGIPSDGTVIRKLDGIGSEAFAYQLEINGNISDLLRLRVGDYIVHASFSSGSGRNGLTIEDVARAAVREFNDSLSGDIDEPTTTPVSER